MTCDVVSGFIPISALRKKAPPSSLLVQLASETPSTTVCCIPRSILSVSVVILETEYGYCGGHPSDRHGGKSYPGGWGGCCGCDSKSSSFNLFVSAFKPTVYSWGCERPSSVIVYSNMEASDHRPHPDAPGSCAAFQPLRWPYRNRLFYRPGYSHFYYSDTLHFL